jgi:hypothetical protein
MRRLYQDRAGERNTEEGHALVMRVEAFLSPIYEQAKADGISLRDVSLLVQDANSMQMLTWILD